MEISACTIMTKSYLPKTRLLIQSFLKHHKNGHLYVLVLDHLGGKVNFRNKRVTPIYFSTLKKMNATYRKLSTKYNALELSCAMKSYFLNYIMNKYKISKLIYLDSDIYVMSTLNELYKKLDHHPILLTPHLLNPQYHLSSTQLPNETSISLTGLFNMGFIGINNSKIAHKFLRWWQRRVHRACYRKVFLGYFLDQKFIDYAPILFPETCIVREVGANVGFWNLHERKIKIRGGNFYVNQRPLLFYHFSGYDEKKPWQLSVHQTRHHLHKNPNLTILYKIYHKKLVKVRAQRNLKTN